MTATLGAVSALANAPLEAALWAEVDAKTKPLGALGRLEPLAVQLGLIQGTLRPELSKPHLVLFAGDHGLTAEGVSAYPAEVTAQMVGNFLRGGAAANVLAESFGLTLMVVNAGVNTPLAPHPLLLNIPVGRGTANSRYGPAMTSDLCWQALTAGADLISRLAASGVNTIAFGEMGIGNTAAAAAIMSLITGAPLAACVGRGTGLSDAALAQKIAVLDTVVARVKASGKSGPLEVLAQCGGFEIAMLVGAIHSAAAHRLTLVIDGFIVTAALLVAHALEPKILPYCVFAHESGELGHRAMLAYLEAEPLLHLGLRLGEGSGAALAIPLLRAAAALLCGMATFASAAVSGNISLPVEA